MQQLSLYAKERMHLLMNNDLSVRYTNLDFVRESRHQNRTADHVAISDSLPKGNWIYQVFRETWATNEADRGRQFET